jgi:hypothetical protein
MNKWDVVDNTQVRCRWQCTSQMSLTMHKSDIPSATLDINLHMLVILLNMSRSYCVLIRHLTCVLSTTSDLCIVNDIWLVYCQRHLTCALSTTSHLCIVSDIWLVYNMSTTSDLCIICQRHQTCALSTTSHLCIVNDIWQCTSEMSLTMDKSDVVDNAQVRCRWQYTSQMSLTIHKWDVVDNAQVWCRWP